MEIRIDESQIQSALNTQATAGIKKAFEGYGVRSAIEKVISDSVVPAIMTTAITSAAESIDIEVLTQHLAKQISISVTKGVQSILLETMVNIILDLRNIPEYEIEKREKERAEIISEFNRV